jgi:DNA-binding transcriptional regulator YiaG
MTEDDANTAETPGASFDATALRRARHEANLTQAQLADRLGVRLYTVEQWEWGTRPVPADMAPAILDALRGDSSAMPPQETVAADDSLRLPRAVGGYDPVAVESLLRQLTETTAHLQADVSASTLRIRELEAELVASAGRTTDVLDESSARDQEDLLRDTLVTAQRAANELREEARRGATSALRKARLRASRTLAEAERALADAHAEAEALQRAAAKQAELTIAEAERARLSIEAELERLGQAARQEAERILRDAEHERRKIRDEISDLERVADAQRAELRVFLQTLLDRVDLPADERDLASVIFEHEMSQKASWQSPGDDLEQQD